MPRAPRGLGHRSNRLLAALEPADFACIEPCLEIVDLPSAGVVYETGDILRYTYFPHDAIVSLATVMENGDTVDIAVFGREGLFGLVTAVFSDRAFGRYTVQVPGTASRIPTERVHEAIAARPDIRESFLRFVEALFFQTLQILACNALHSVEKRCCRWILSMHDRMEQDTLPLTHELLAEMIGVQRSTISTITRHLQMRGLINQHRGAITVIDRASLEATTCECYGKIRANFKRLLPGHARKHRNLAPTSKVTAGE